MNHIKIVDSQDITTSIASLKKQLSADRIFILADKNTYKLCLPTIDTELLQVSHVIVIADGDENKNLTTLTTIWDILIEKGATRHSLLVNIGGGMVTDIGGFAATSFKRGMYFANIPTTLLAAVDASSGGKTGINYKDLKNEIGAFAFPKAVFINIDFFSTLSSENILSGYAEMVKHSLLADKHLFNQTMEYDIEKLDTKRLKHLIDQNLVVKNYIVESDPYELGKRRALNLGHTIGHAIETLSYRKEKPLLHGYAVMWGLVGELYISCKTLKLDKEVLASVLSFTKTFYGSFPFSCEDYDAILDIMKHDKKNSFDNINFTLLAGVGDMRVNQIVERDLMLEALDFIREN